jgi:hypothetical protein
MRQKTKSRPSNRTARYSQSDNPREREIAKQFEVAPGTVQSDQPPFRDSAA